MSEEGIQYRLDFLIYYVAFDENDDHVDNYYTRDHDYIPNIPNVKEYEEDQLVLGKIYDMKRKSLEYKGYRKIKFYRQFRGFSCIRNVA